MTANDTRKVLDRWKEFYFFPERDDFVVLLAGLVAIPFDLLRPRDHHAEVSRFRELSQFGGFRGRKNLGFQAYRFEMSGSQLASCGIHRTHEFRIVTHLLEHARVLAPHGTVHHRGPRSLDNGDRKSTRLNSSHVEISYAVFCLKKKKN